MLAYNFLPTKKAYRHQSLRSKLPQRFAARAPARTQRGFRAGAHASLFKTWETRRTLIYRLRAIAALSREHGFARRSPGRWLNQQVGGARRTRLPVKAVRLLLTASPQPCSGAATGSPCAAEVVRLCCGGGVSLCHTQPLPPHLCYPTVGHNDPCDFFCVEQPASLQALGPSL